jgi:gamma-glutamyltranspeptidase
LAGREQVIAGQALFESRNVQPQAMFQTFLRMARGTEPQSAIDAPRAESRSFPDAFWPHSYEPGLMCIEDEFASFRAPLEARGHRLQVVRGNDARMGAVVLAGIRRDGLRNGAADARCDSVALAK